MPVTPFDFDLLAEVLDASASAPILLGWLTSAQIVRALAPSRGPGAGVMRHESGVHTGAGRTSETPKDAWSSAARSHIRTDSWQSMRGPRLGRLQFRDSKG